MKGLLLALTLLSAHTAWAYEYKLQFTPASGARGLVVAGYYFSNNTVFGNCSYYRTTSTGGRGARTITTHYYNTCAWDLYGNLLSLTPGSPPAAPPVLSTSGTETIYSINGSSSTGVDSRGFGFVDTLSSHYSWVTPSGGYAVIPYAAYSVTATLASDGDYALAFSPPNVAASVSGSITPSPGTATISSTTCPSSMAPGTSCSVTVLYNPQSITCIASPYGYAYTKIDLSLVTDAGANTDFTEGFTITGVPICDD